MRKKDAVAHPLPPHDTVADLFTSVPARRGSCALVRHEQKWRPNIALGDP